MTTAVTARTQAYRVAYPAPAIPAASRSHHRNNMHFRMASCRAGRIARAMPGIILMMRGGELTKVANDSGDRYLSLTYDQGRIAWLPIIPDGASPSVMIRLHPTCCATDALGGTWHYQYDSAHRLTRDFRPGRSHHRTNRIRYTGTGGAPVRWE